jgi:TPR repeat protein
MLYHESCLLCIKQQSITHSLLFLVNFRVAQFHDVPLLARETGCLPSFISKGIALGCFYYARCLHEGHGVKKCPEEAKKYYSKVCTFVLFKI